MAHLRATDRRTSCRSPRGRDGRARGSWCEHPDTRGQTRGAPTTSCRSGGSSSLPWGECRLPPVNRPTVAESTSTALTEGIRVRVQSQYLPEQSSPRDDRYVFAYTITIANESTFTAQLRTRHWIITNGRGEI